MKFVIKWKSRINGRAGKGTKEFGREEAEPLVDELNQDYPDIAHEIIPAPPQASMAHQVESSPELADTDTEEPSSLAYAPALSSE